MPGRDFWKVYAPLAAVALAGLLWAIMVMAPPPPGTIRFAAGAQGGAYYTLAERYRRLLAEQGIDVVVIATAGSVDNLRLLEEDEADVAIVQGGLASAADAELLRAAGGLFEEPFWVFVQVDHPARSFADLREARMAIGLPGSGTRALADIVQREFGGAWAQTARLEMGSAEAQAALFAGEIDAAAFAASAQAPYIQALLRSGAFRLLPFEEAPPLSRRIESLSEVVLVRGVVDIGLDIPDRDLPLIAAIAQLTVRQDIHPAIEAVLVDAAALIHSEPGVFSKGGSWPSLAYSDLPVSAQVARFYRDGPSFLRRYFPFGLANFMERAWVLLIPLLTLAFPLLRATPPIYRWRVRRRIYVWYKDLRALEARGRALEPGDDRAAIGRELERLQVEVGKLEVPLSYTDDLYRLRSQIEFVKQLLMHPESLAGTAQRPVSR